MKITSKLIDMFFSILLIALFSCYLVFGSFLKMWWLTYIIDLTGCIIAVIFGDVAYYVITTSTTKVDLKEEK